MKDYENRLKGGHPNSLGNTLEVVEQVLGEPETLEELFNCYFSDDEVVRLRVSNALKRIGKARLELLIPYIDRLLTEIKLINQASTQWTLAQLFELLEKHLTQTQRQQAVLIMKHNLEHHDDWIVLNMTMQTLGKWARNESDLATWMRPHLDQLAADKRKSVSKKALKTLSIID